MRPTSILPLFLIAACGVNEPEIVTTVFDTLSSGTVVATSGEVGSWAAGTQDAWAPELILSIGAGDSQEEAYLFGSIRGVVLDGLDRIWVLEGQANEIRVFDMEGIHVRTIGRQGQGPAEFMRPTAMSVTPDGNIMVVDPGNGRFQLFDTAGVDLGTIPRTAGGFQGSWSGGFDEDGFIREPSRTPESFNLLRIDPSTGSALDSIPLPRDETDRFILRTTQNGQLVGIRVLSIPFATERFWAIRGNTLWTSTGDSFQMSALSMSSGLDTMRITRRDIPMEPVTDAEVEGYWETVDLTPAEVRRLDLSKIPEMKRAFERFFVDQDGFLWASRWVDGVYGSRQSAQRSYDVFKSDGRLLGTLSLPLKPSPTPWVKDGIMVGVHADELDVPVVTVYRIRGRDTE